ncbi:hypothetical protein R3P38DRAFT_1835348 [Favolaschia claudopus]|uniref:Uncharacterized protein n=1 Tax=Favolaschia claudopus TaxID=2862362 RepID=A0AAW0A3X5_9AGAR
MATSPNADVFYALGIHRAPASASIPEFERLMESIADEIKLLPVCQENFLKMDTMFQTDKADEHTPALGMGPRPLAMFFVCEAETLENFQKVLASPQVRHALQKGTDFGNQSSIFTYSKVPKIDRTAPDSGVQMMFVYDAPLELATSENHIGEFDEFISGFVQLPGIQKNFARLEMWQSMENLDQDVRNFGYSTESRPTLYCATLKDLDAAKEMLSDPATQRYFASAADGRQEFDPKKYSYGFVANVVTKLDNTKK